MRKVYQCIVCGGDCQEDLICSRCSSDNTAWDEWKRRHPVERGGWIGLQAFTEPYFHLPLFTTVLALAFGLIGLGGFWDGVKASIQAMVVIVTVNGCLLATLGVYWRRLQIRQQQLLNQILPGWVWLKDANFIAVASLVLSLLVVLLLPLALVFIDPFWELARWLLLEPGYGGQVGVQARILDGLPLFLLLAYGILMVSITYVSSLQLALRYARKMNQELPQPIFLNERLLTEVIKSEIAAIIGLWSQGRDIIIEGFRRTRRGGLELAVYVIKPDFPTRAYTVKTDAWGRIRKISKRRRSDKEENPVDFKTSDPSLSHSKSDSTPSEAHTLVFDFQGYVETQSKTNSEAPWDTDVVSKLNHDAPKIIKEMLDELGRLLPSFPSIEMHIEFYEGSIGWAGILVILGTVADIGGTIDLATRLAQLIRLVIKRILQRRFRNLGVPLASPIQVDVTAQPTNGQAVVAAQITRDENVMRSNVPWSFAVLILTVVNTLLLLVLLGVQAVTN